MSLWSDLKILWHLAVSPIRGKTHSERLESFYGKQAQGYDHFRKRLVKGRQQLWSEIPVTPGMVAVDMGGGTGANLDFWGDRIGQIEHIYLVDLSGSLLKVAQQRVNERGWKHITTVEADATAWQPPQQVDLVTFSYSLTMIPDWFAAIDQAEKILKPGGMIAVVDFYVSRKYPDTGKVRHPWLTQIFWPLWFRNDNVFPSADHVPYLHRKFDPVLFTEHRGSVPYLPFSRVPYYRFIGRKRPETQPVPNGA